MPELPEVETTRAGIVDHIRGQRVAAVRVRQAKLRWPIPAGLDEHLQGYEVEDVQRRGKYLIIRFVHGSLLVHLGMSGSLRILRDAQDAQKHDHVDIEFSNGCCLRYTDPRRFGAILWCAQEPEAHPLLVSLGPEPLSDDFDGDLLFRLSRKRKAAVKSFIMDSKVVVGVGNIYATEALFLAGIDPRREAGSLSKARYMRLAEIIKQVLAAAIAQGGTTLKDFVGGDGKPGYFQQQLNVYGRKGEACVNCKRALKEITIAQRSSVYCRHCQS